MTSLILDYCAAWLSATFWVLFPFLSLIGIFNFYHTDNILKYLKEWWKCGISILCILWQGVLLDLIWKQIRSFSFLPPQYTSVTLILLFADVSWCPILPPPNSSATAFPCSFETTLSWSRSHLLPMNSTGLHVWGVELYGMNHNFDIVVSCRNSRKKERKKHFI